jgi:sugar phosphate permease
MTGEVTTTTASQARRRWITLLLVWAAFLISFLDRLAWANVAVTAGESFGLQLAALNVFVTAFYTGYVLSNFVSGLAADLFGGRRMLALALVPLGIFTFLFGSTRTIAMGLALQALMGLAAGADYSAGVKLIAAWFERAERGRAMGFYCTAPILGVTITNALVPVSIGVVGWTGIYQLFGAATIALGVICYAVLRDQPPARTTPVSGRAVVSRATIAGLVRNRDLIFLTLAGFGAMWGSWGFAFWVNALMIRGHGLSAATAGAIVSLFGLGAIVGNPLIGFLSDWLGGLRKLPIIVCLVAFVALLVVFGGLGSEHQFRIVAPILGIAAFVYMPLLTAMVTEVAGVALAGSATGLSNAIWQMGSIIVPVVVGVVFHWTGSFQAAFAALAAGPLFGAVCMTFVREPRG